MRSATQPAAIAQAITTMKAVIPPAWYGVGGAPTSDAQLRLRPGLGVRWSPDEPASSLHADGAGRPRRSPARVGPCAGPGPGVRRLRMPPLPAGDGGGPN